MKSTHRYGVFAAALVFGVVAGNTQAAPLTFTGAYPDIFADTGRAVYTVSNHTLILTGTAEFTNLSASTSAPITSGSFMATVVLTPTGGSGSTETFNVASGSLNVAGTSGTLLASTQPLHFGYSVPTDNFQIVFGSGTGSDVGPTGQIAVSYHADGGVANYSTNYFDADFSTSSVVKIGTADIFPTPEPASVAILGLAAPLFLRRRRHA